MVNKSTEDYQKEFEELTGAAMKAQLDSLTAQSVKDKGVIDQKADDAIADAENTYTEKVKEESEKTNTEHQKNAINRVLNERYINERMANLGLSDSGYANVSQMGAQAYYQNTSKEITEAQQKTLDTLAAALRENKESTEDWRTEQKANIDATLEANQLKVKNQYLEDAEKYASDMVKKDTDTKIAQIQLENKLNKVDELGDPQYTDDEKRAMVSEYILRNGADEEYLREIGYENLYYEGWGPTQWRTYFKTMKDAGISDGKIKEKIERLFKAGILRGQNLWQQAAYLEQDNV